MSEEFESQSKREEREDKQVGEIVNFIVKNDLSGTEIESAYLIAMDIGLGNPDVEDVVNPPRKEVYLLAAKMKQLMNEGLVVNRITELIDSEKKYEKDISEAVHNYNARVDGSNFTVPEKKCSSLLLKSCEKESWSYHA